jgi:hypothetical protein
LGVNIKLNGSNIEAGEYSISESATPLSGGDSSGAVGTITIREAVSNTKKSISHKDLNGKVDFIDSARGITSGSVSVLSKSKDGDSWDIESDSRLSAFMIDVQVQPFSGVLGDAFLGYAAYANITTNITVSPIIYNVPVNFPGFSGNLWTYMKEIAVAYGIEINLISGVVRFRPVRSFTAVEDAGSTSSVTYDSTVKAHEQEVIWYKTKRLVNGLIYPPGGWTPETKIISVNAGEDAEHILETDASITSIQTPVMLNNVAPGYSSGSVYTIVGDDNIPIQPPQWRDYGGSLTVSIDPDTRRLLVKMRGPKGLVKIDGTPMRNFRVALSAGTSDSTYSTLRIVGDAVHLQKNSIIIPTGIEYPMNIDGSVAVDRVVKAPTIDSDFINSLDAACSAGARGASRYSGKLVKLSANVSAVNQSGQQGSELYPTWQFAEDVFTPGTYADFDASNFGRNYGQLDDYLVGLVRDGTGNQLFGNVAGARFWDRDSRMWFRVRDATTTWVQTTISADSDVTWADHVGSCPGKTYGDLSSKFSGSTYRDVTIGGLPKW